MDNRIRWMVLLAATLTLALVAAACGNGGSGRDSAGAEQGATIGVSLRDFSISPTEISAPADGPVTINVTNDGQTQHSFAIDTGNGQTVQTDLLDPGASTTLLVPALGVGTYQGYCTVPGHKDLGMIAPVLVGQAQTAQAGQTGEGEAGSTGGAGSMMGGGMTAEQMAQAHEAGVQAFPADTQGTGNQVFEPTIQGGVKVFELTAKQVRWEVSPGVFKDAMAYNGQIPGPEIQVHQGDRIRVVLTNELSQPTALHFHGMTVPNKDDGVPYITQDPIMPGGYYVYEFTVKDPPGTYAYHSHFNSLEQVGSGLYGALVVEPKHPTWNQEYPLFLGDGPLGYTLNGKGFPATAPLVANRGDWVLIHLANFGSLLHPMHLHGYHFEVIAQDGGTLETPFSVDTLVVAPGETFDVLVHAVHPGTWAFHCHILSHVEGPQGMFGMVTALVVQ